MSIKRALSAALVALGVGLAGSANAGAIFTATSAVINSGGPGFGSINNTFDQSGLSAGYTANVTDFNTYIGSNPTHSLVFSGLEWFSNSGSNSARVTFDFGSVRTFDALALWNEEVSGIGRLNLLTSTDGVNFTSLASVSPTDNPDGSSYGAEVFGFGAVSAQYVQFDMSGCPQNNGNFPGCAIGEIAFREAQQSVPEPGALSLLGLGLVGIGALRRRRAAK